LPSATVVAGKLTRGGTGDYTGAFSLSEEGVYQVTASYAASGVTSTPVNLKYDKTAPVFAVTFPAPDREDGGTALTVRDPAAGYDNAWRRDETVTITARSAAKDVAASTVQLVVYGVGDGGTTGTAFPAGPMAQASSCDAGYCGTYTLNLWDPQLKAFRGQYMLVVNGNDTSGNVGMGDAGLPVTRWKWSYNLSPAVPIKASPAIGSAGRVYVGNSSGKFVGLAPNGVPDWTFTGAPINVSPAVGVAAQGREVVYVAGSGTMGQLIAVDGSDGGIIDSCLLQGDYKGSLALGPTTVAGSTLESAFGVLSAASVEELVAFRPDAGASKCRDFSGAPVISTESSVLVNNGSVYYGDATGEVQSFQFSNGNWSMRAGWPALVNVSPRSLAFVNGSVLGGGNSGFLRGGVFSLNDADGGIGWTWSGQETYNPVVDVSGAVLIGTMGAAVTSATLQSVANGDAGVSAPGVRGVSRGTPVLGNGGFVYSANYGGAIQCWKGSLVPEWEVDDPARLGNIEASPTLDCPRDAQGRVVSGPWGVLYVGSNNGQLFAVIVDSRGIDTTAPWPKYQHDPRNTGNAQTPLSQFACP